MNKPFNDRTIGPVLRTAAAVTAGLLCFTVAQSASALAPAWPADSSWIPLTAPWAPTGVFDGAGDNVGTASRDLVGDATNPTAYVFADAQSLFFRLRIGADPLQSPGNLTAFGWGCEIITVVSGTPATQSYEFIAEVDGVANPDQVDIATKSTNAANAPGSTADKPPFAIYSALTADIGTPPIDPHAKTSLATTTFGGNPNFFIDFTIDRADLTSHGVTDTTPLRFVCGSSSSAQALSADLMGPTGSTTLTDMMSNPFICGPLGCTSCFTAAACGSSCAACAGTTPLCKPYVGCVQCLANTDCASTPATPICNLTSGVCEAVVGCTTSVDCTDPAFPVCDGTTHQCRACAANGECTSAAAPACNTSGLLQGQCTECTTTNITLCTSAKPACLTTGVCGCALDSECASTSWCDTLQSSCLVKVANGAAIPTVANHTPPLTGICDASVGAAVCESGVCDTSDNLCGYANGSGPCTSLTSTSVCRSGTCSVSGVCMPAGGCAVDADCGADQWCNAGACASKLANGTAIPTVAGHTPALTGTCTAEVALAVCTSGVCDVADNSCGYANGSGPCTAQTAAAVCRSGACSVTGLCIAAGSCSVDADCGADQWCNGGTCAAKLSNGTAIPTVGGHTPTLDGTCTTVAAQSVCASGVCDTADNLCGFADGHGTCTQQDAAIVCRSGACSTAGMCISAGSCAVDADCASDKWCNAGACVEKLANGTAIPTVGGHTPALDGTCTTEAGAAVCVSGVCDTTDNACGFANGQGTCTTANAATVCRSGLCGETGANQGKCVACNTDQNCSGATPACSGSQTCVQCTSTNGTACSGTSTTPLCDTTNFLCAGCTGDKGSTGSRPCPDAAPLCKNDGSCFKCASNTDCAGHTGQFCDTTTGECTATCFKDADCGNATSGKICSDSNHLCVDGCRGQNGNGCPTGKQCSSTTYAPGTCQSVADAGPDAKPEPQPEAGVDAGKDAIAEASAEAGADAPSEAAPIPPNHGESLQGGGLSCATAQSGNAGSSAVLLGIAAAALAFARRRQSR